MILDNEHKNYYKEKFIKFYGEKYRTLIEEKFNSLTIFVLQDGQEKKEETEFGENLHDRLKIASDLFKSKPVDKQALKNDVIEGIKQLDIKR